MSKVKGLFQYTVFFAVLLLFACSDFHAPVEDFLDEYANRAAIGSQAVSVPTLRDRDGVECVSSETTVTITFFLRNPRSYVITPALTFNNPGLSQSQGFISQSPDCQSITLTFLQSYLASNDRGIDFSGTISLTEATTGRPFPSWDYSLRCNTPPPRPEGVRIMLDSSNEYVLCFNLDLSNPVHQDDIAVVRINGTEYYPTTVNAGPISHGIIFANNLDKFPETPPDTTPLPNQPDFVPGDVPVYFLTGIPQSATTQNFTITVEDVMGLSRTASTSTAGEMLSRVTVTDTAGNPPDTGETLNLSPDGGGNYRVMLSHDDPGATIHYTWDGTQHSVSAASQQNITVMESGDLEVWATRTGYIESDHRTIHLVCRNNQYYVDPNVGYDTPSTPGTRSQPFMTIEYAITQFIDRTDPGNTIFLLGDVTPSNGGGTSGVVDIDPADAIILTIDGSEASGGAATINGSNSVRGLFVDANTYTVNLTLRNLTIRDGQTDSGGAGIFFEAADNGSSLTLNGCMVEENYVSGDGRWGGGVYFVGGNLTIDNTQIRNNTITPAVGNSYGAGMYIGGVGSSPTATISNTDGPVEITGNELTCATGQGGGIYASEIDLTISGAIISDNTANKSGAGFGGGIYQYRGTLTIENGASISQNKGTIDSSYTGYGGGIAYYGTTLDINGAEISGNTASTQGSGLGGGVYVNHYSTYTTTVNLTDVTIRENDASTGSAGYGGGLYAQRTNGGTTNIYLTGGSITDNTASNRDGLGGGIYISTNSNTGLVGLYSLSGSAVEITGNKATTSNTAFGYGGGIYVGHGGQVEWEDGTISGNWANENGTGVTNSQGEGIYIQGAVGYTTSFNFAGGTIDESVSTVTGNVVYLNADSEFYFRGETFIESYDPNAAGGIYLNHAVSPSSPPVIQAVGYLTASTVAHLVPSTYTWIDPILTGDAAINYYKFTVERNGGTNYCINADGELSRIVPVNTINSLQLDQTLSSVTANTYTYEITAHIDLSNSFTFTVTPGLHVRIIPNSSFNHDANVQLFNIQQGGHLLFGDPVQNIEIDLQNSIRQDHLFDLIGSGSLVLRNVTVKNASTGFTGTPPNAALVASGATVSPAKSTVVFEGFHYLEDVTVVPDQSRQSALQLDTGSEYHFVSGSITGFNVWEFSYGGVANIEGTGRLTIHGGTFSGNTTTGTPARSVSGTLSGLIIPAGLVLD